MNVGRSARQPKIAHRCHDSVRVSLSVVGPSQKCLSSPRTPLTGQVSVGFAFEVLGNPSYERHFVDERNACGVGSERPSKSRRKKDGVRSWVALKLICACVRCHVKFSIFHVSNLQA